MNINDIIDWLKNNYETVDLPQTFYIRKDDKFSTLDKSICIIKPAYDDKEYAHNYSISLEQLCTKLLEEFKDK